MCVLICKAVTLCKIFVSNVDKSLLCCKTICVVFCKKCEAENVLIVVQIWAEVLVFERSVSLIVCYFLILVCKQS